LSNANLSDGNLSETEYGLFSMENIWNYKIHAQNAVIYTLEYRKKALTTHDDLNDKVELAGDYHNIRVVFWKLSRSNEALGYKALAIHEGLNDKVEMAKDYSVKGLHNSKPI
jgi:hypothetical protein